MPDDSSADGDDVSGLEERPRKNARTAAAGAVEVMDLTLED